MKMTVEAYEKGLKFRNGRFVGILEPGRYRIRRWWADERIIKIDARLRTLVLQGQDMMTLDKVTLRLTVLAKMRVVDAAAAVLKVDDYVAQVYGDVQLALRAQVGTLELDPLLADKARLGEQILPAVKASAEAFGVEVVKIGVRDIVLPGDMKAILNQVMEARKKAEASLILRRDEVAATRSLANTAQLLEKNPTLMKLKVLEALEKLSTGETKLVLPAEFLSQFNKEV